MVQNLRARLNRERTETPAWLPVLDTVTAKSSEPASRHPVVLLAEDLQGIDPGGYDRLVQSLGGAQRVGPAPPETRLIAESLQAGLHIPQPTLDSFVGALRHARCLVVEEGRLHGPLRQWLPRVRVQGIGEALVTRKLLGRIRSDDMLILESAGFSSDQERLVRVFDALQSRVGFDINLDLARMPMASGGNSLQGQHDPEAAGCMEQARWILEDRTPARLLVEDAREMEVYRRVTDAPVAHLTAALV